MAVWLDTTPVDGLANLIYSNIQTVKSDIIARLRCTNASFDEHDFYGTSSSTGRHIAASVGFVKSHATLAALTAFIAANNPPNGSLHYVGGTLYLMVDETPTAVSIIDHGSLLTLTGADHPQYLDTAGLRLITGDMNVASAFVGITGARTLIENRSVPGGVTLNAGLSSLHATSIGTDVEHHDIINAFFDTASVGIEDLRYGPVTTSTSISLLYSTTPRTIRYTEWSGMPLALYNNTTPLVAGSYAKFHIRLSASGISGGVNIASLTYGVDYDSMTGTFELTTSGVS
jgi:hypothetical protein